MEQPPQNDKSGMTQQWQIPSEILDGLTQDSKNHKTILKSPFLHWNHSIWHGDNFLAPIQGTYAVDWNIENNNDDSSNHYLDGIGNANCMFIPIMDLMNHTQVRTNACSIEMTDNGMQLQLSSGQIRRCNGVMNFLLFFCIRNRRY